MPILFCNIAWMKDYAGRSDKDKPLGGGGFVEKKHLGGEEGNFIKCEDGYVYGYFETTKGNTDRNVLIENLGAKKTDDLLSGVDIVWTAPRDGKRPRVVVGWYRNAQIYRSRQDFNNNYPSDKHLQDKFDSFRVKAKIEDVVLLPPEQRTMELNHGKGWSGMTSWWYAGQTSNHEAKKFVKKVKALLGSGSHQAVHHKSKKNKSNQGRAGAAASKEYQRYVKQYEAKIPAHHHELEKKFKAFLRKSNPTINFPQCFRDDLRYEVKGQSTVMVEIKPTDISTLRYAIRTAMGQLLDYKQQQKWTNRQLIVVGTEVKNADDQELAFQNGFGLAWPDNQKGFKISWP